MSNDKMHEEFEAWYAREYLTSGETILRAYDAQGGKAEHYQRWQEEMQWCAWKASRAALVIELPEAFDQDGEMGLDYEETIAGLESVGLKVKR